MIEADLFPPAGPKPFLDRMNAFSVGSVKSTRCEVALQYGLFFDGTDNNYRRDKETFGDSNIARLWMSYPIRPEMGISATYVPGVGTDFSEIDAEAEGWIGTAFGIGCEARVLFALLKTLEFVRRFVDHQRPPFTKDQLNALCEKTIVTSRAKKRVLSRMGLEYSLQELEDNFGGRRRAFFETETADLANKLRSSPVRIKTIVIDIFGFSRGAAEARAYATWLCETLIDGRYAGIPLTIRFIGLFDTVASAGVEEMVGNALNKTTGGHSGWARPESLRIPPEALNCVHFVAMHEIRKNFPVDSIFNGGSRPKNFHEFAYPGSHSDVGGGYRPGELGIAGGIPSPLGDAMKLSQIPLNHLFDYAVAAGVPLSKDFAMSERSYYDPFAVSEKLKLAFNAFLSLNGKQSRTVADWTKVYLAWRWQIRNRYNEIGHVRNAKDDQQFLLMANQKLIEDAQHLLRSVPSRGPGHVVKDMFYRSDRASMELLTPVDIGNDMEAEANEVLQHAMALGAPNAGFAEFFDQYVHDSYAGFCKSLKEPTGYWRYRKRFEGSAKPMNADLGDENPKIRHMG